RIELDDRGNALDVPALQVVDHGREPLLISDQFGVDHDPGRVGPAVGDRSSRPDDDRPAQLCGCEVAQPDSPYRSAATGSRWWPSHGPGSSTYHPMSAPGRPQR